MTRRLLYDLSRAECFTLLHQHHVGRFVYADDLGPAAVPVNYALAGEQVVFRSETGAKVRDLDGQRVALEADHIDTANHAGWSVLLRGTAEVIEVSVEGGDGPHSVPDVVRRLDGDLPLPWKKGIHNIWVVITPSAVTGRHLADTTEEDFF
jgi:nitroimidazol reductase NimA-like FMN-containing flavoprotein (pyridoxamine 5'-phosphate oxidase superfamily)